MMCMRCSLRLSAAQTVLVEDTVGHLRAARSRRPGRFSAERACGLVRSRPAAASGEQQVQRAGWAWYHAAAGGGEWPLGLQGGGGGAPPCAPPSLARSRSARLHAGAGQGGWVEVRLVRACEADSGGASSSACRRVRARRHCRCQGRAGRPGRAGCRAGQAGRAPCSMLALMASGSTLSGSVKLRANLQQGEGAGAAQDQQRALAGGGQLLAAPSLPQFHPQDPPASQRPRQPASSPARQPAAPPASSPASQPAQPAAQPAHLRLTRSVLKIRPDSSRLLRCSEWSPWMVSTPLADTSTEISSGSMPGASAAGAGAGARAGAMAGGAAAASEWRLPVMLLLLLQVIGARAGRWQGRARLGLHAAPGRQDGGQMPC